MVSEFERVVVTPNTLTEASNLLGQRGEPEHVDLDFLRAATAALCFDKILTWAGEGRGRTVAGSTKLGSTPWCLGVEA